MAKPGQSSFRRVLLSKILVLSVPVLLIGETVTFMKARSSLLETARWNLTESAVKKGENINNEIAALKTNLLMASQTSVLQKSSAGQAQKFLDGLAPQLPPQTQCLQLTNIQTSKLIASTCGNQKIDSDNSYSSWKSQLKSEYISPDWIEVKAVLPGLQRSQHQADKAGTQHPQGQLQLLLSAPVYNNAGKLQYVLSVQSAFHQKESDQPGLLAGSTVVITQDGTILAHPIPERVGRNIARELDAQRLKSIITQAIAGRKDFLHLSFDKNGPELLAGYNVIPSPITNKKSKHWIILAVAQMDNALFGLQEIKVILMVLTVGLLGANLLATLYLTRDLARPLEKLRDYALNLQGYHAAEQVPHNFQIREVEQLAEAIDHMLERLKASAEEIETAWQEAQASNQMKSEFLATTSHELRTPLNAIIGCIRLVRDGCCDDRDEESEFLERADEAAIHLLGIINDLLDIAKIEAGKLSVVLEPIDLRQILKEVINLETVHIQQKGLQLIAAIEQEPILVKADPAKLKQVVLNVVGNAVKFTDSGSIKIETQSKSKIDSGDSHSRSWVVVTVQDTGVGIDPAQQHKLFRPFVMVDGTTTRKYGGTGLGLAISRNLIELMGGSITLYSPGYGKGTTAEITLPLVEISLLPTAPTSEPRSHHLQPESSHSFSNACEVSLPDLDLGEHLEASPVFDTHQPFTKSKG
ncbi:MAG TPA: sensor histidine kinase [Leptolyngbyaceae cyanobacterium]